MRLAARGNEISVIGRGEAEESVRRLLAGFSELLAMGYELRASDVATAIRVAREDPEASIVEFFLESQKRK